MPTCLAGVKGKALAPETFRSYVILDVKTFDATGQTMRQLHHTDTTRSAAHSGRNMLGSERANSTPRQAFGKITNFDNQGNYKIPSR